MSGVLRKRGALLLGAGAIGVGLVADGKLLGPDKKQTVLWGMSGELDKVNTEVDKAREQAFGRQAGGEALKGDEHR